MALIAPVLLALALLLPAAAVVAADCPPRGAPQVRLELRDPEPEVTTAGVDALHVETGVPRGETAHHLGVTSSRVEWRSEITARLTHGPDGSACAVPGQVRIVLDHAEHSVRIAQELPREGCLWREVLAHEQRHVAVNRHTLREAAEQVRRATTEWAASAEARARNPDAAMDRLQAGLRRAIGPALARMRAERARRHGAIDTETEYRRLGRVCPDEQAKLRRLLRPH